jgi:hypothetical protein
MISEVQIAVKIVKLFLEDFLLEYLVYLSFFNVFFLVFFEKFQKLPVEKVGWEDEKQIFAVRSQVWADFFDFLYEYYKPDHNGRFISVKYQEACTSGHVTKSVLCKMLEETFTDESAHKEGFRYIPVSEEVFDLIVPVEQLKMLGLLK